MSNITRIDVQLVTGTRPNAGTDGEVYIGIAGREFYTDSSSDDFEKGANVVYVLGDGATIKFADENDPRTPQLVTEDLDKYPAYLRFEPVGSGPDWNVEQVTVTVNPGRNQIKFDNARLSGKPDIWLGQKYGKFIYLARN